MICFVRPGSWEGFLYFKRVVKKKKKKEKEEEKKVTETL